VRSHAKAAAVGSTRRRGKRRAAVRLSISSCAAVALLAAFAPAFASAGLVRVPEPFSPLTGSGSGLTIETPGGIALDETSGNVFLNDGTTKTDILGAEGGAPAGLVAPFEITGLSFVAANGIAVDNSVTSPNKGTVYVLSHSGPSKLKKFKRDAPSEKYVAAGELPLPTGANSNGGVAVDTVGNVFAGSFAGEAVAKFNPAGTLEKTYNLAEPNPVVRPGPLAVDAAGDLFVARTGGGSVHKFPADGSGEIDTSNFVQVIPGGATGIAVDPVRNTLFIAMGTRVVEYDATTLAKESEWGIGTLGATTRIAVNSATNRVYVSDNGAGKKNVVVFGSPVPLPTTKANAASDITGTKATLNGTINPEGLAVEDCFFEYGEDLNGEPNYEQEVECEALPPTDSASHPVSADISGLVPNGTTYHFRLVASNENGTEQSPDKTFVTANTVGTEPATGIGTIGATLNGALRPEGDQFTSCAFEYGLSTSAGFEEEAQCTPPAASIEPDFSIHAVSAALSGLKSNATYKFRLTATNSEGTLSGETLTFTTLGPPQITELRASFAGQSSATLEARIDPSGFATSYRFEWGPTTAYGTSVPADFEPFVGSGEPVRVTAKVGGLSAAGTYHFRIVATNSVDVTESPDQTLETLNSCGLPDGRCFELVSPWDVGPNSAAGLIAAGNELEFQAARTGSGAVAYDIENGLPDSTQGGAVLFRGKRGSGGWSSTQLSPPILVRNELAGPSSAASATLFLSSDLSCGVVASSQPLTGDAGTNFAREAGGSNLYRTNPDGSFTAITTLPPQNTEEEVKSSQGLFGGVFQNEYKVLGATQDCRKVVFSAQYIYPGVDCLGTNRLYEWDEGALRCVGIVPGPSGDAPVVAQGGADHNHFNVLSQDGSRVFFSAMRKASPNPAEIGKVAVFVREDGTSTRDLSLSQTSTPDEGATYQYATKDGSRVFLTANAGLTDESSSEGTDLYEYDLESEELTDLTVNQDEGGAAVAGFVGASEDGSRVYFLAKGQLVPGRGRTFAENQGTGAYSLYSAREGDIRFVASIDVVESEEFKAITVESLDKTTSRVSPDGTYLLFETSSNVTGYESGGKFAKEAYLYDSQAEATVCVSCRQDGQPSVAADSANTSAFNPLISRIDVNSLLSPPATLTERDGEAHVFFYSRDRLAAGAVEGLTNLYEWAHGQVFTIIAEPPNLNNVQNQNTAFNIRLGGASADGSDLYFATPETLTWEDGDERASVYDARIGGGFPEPAPPPNPCDPNSEGSCQAPAPSGTQTPNPASATFSGPGNAKPKARHKKRKKRHQRKRGRGRKQGKANKVKGKRKQAKRQRQRTARHANANRRAGK
jgi:uncharacterized protein YegP (UPF0339 family)